jgi:hypothetical protein
MRSQSTPGAAYTVDMNHYTCTCPSFLRITFCKHIHAVETYFDPTFQPEDLDSTAESVSDLDSEDSSIDCETGSMVQVRFKDSRCLSHIELAGKLESLAARLRTSSNDTANDSNLIDLNCYLDTCLAGFTSSNILPRTLKLPPNQRTWTETAKVMGAVKTRRKRLHTDPYAAGEQSGTLVKTKQPHKRYVRSTVALYC